MNLLTAEEIKRAVRQALKEDVGSGDTTTLATVPASARARGVIVAREPLVLAGIDFGKTSFELLSRKVKIERRASDGQKCPAGAVLLEISGPARALLTGERVALNFMQRLSGIATKTAEFVQKLAGTQARILDTRKTTPGWRRFEKYAVATGGGTNHRFGLFDMILIKDNHLAALQNLEGDPIAAAVARARAAYPRLKVEVETDTLEQVANAVAARPDFILLDNMNLEQLREAVRICKGIAQTEASGGVNLETVRPIAETGVDFISAGALTHSARSVDIALDFLA